MTVTTQPECSWTATAEASWITGLAPAQGQGDGQVQFQAAANPNNTARSGAINVNGQRAVIQQGASAACDFDLRINVSQFPASGGAGAVTVSGPGGCAWGAVSNVSWIVVSPSGGSGSGEVSFTVAANSGAARAGTIIVGGHPVTIQQAAANAPTCTVTIAPTSQSVTAAGATGISVTVTAPSGCARPATSNAAWITIASGATGTGNGAVTLNVAANTGAARTGTVTIGGQTFTVNQAGAPLTCTIAINPTSQSIPASGASGITVGVSAPTGCPWTATTDTPWLTITAGASGSGNGTVTLNAGVNTGSARTGVATIGGTTFTVSQAGAAVQCSYSINPAAQTVGRDAATGLTLAVTAGAGCAWTSTSNVPWLTITAGANGSGDGSVVFNVAGNTGSSRTGTMTIAGQTFTVNQAGICEYAISPTSQQFDRQGGTASVAVTAPTGCGWTATSQAGFVTITAGASGTGSGTVTYTVSSYNGNGTRTGAMTIAGQTFTVTQQR